MKKKLERRVVCVGAMISGLHQPKDETENPLGDYAVYMHPCMRRLSYVTKEEIELIKRYSRNERASHERHKGHYK